MGHKSCLGCVHYRKFSTVVTGGVRGCHYMLDTGEPRGCSPENCTKKEAAYERQPPKNERK